MSTKVAVNPYQSTAGGQREASHTPDLFAAAAEDRAYMFWKVSFWGTDRDKRLLDRLRCLQTLGDLAGKPKERKRWVKGQGFQPWDQEKYNANPKKYPKPKPRWWSDDAWFLGATSEEWGVWLLTENCRQIGKHAEQLRRKPAEALFTAPLVLVNEGCSRFAFSDFDVLFQHSLQSIAGPKKDEDLLLFLTALLNSPLSLYYLFHTSANWGVERDKVHFEELLQLPFPLPEQTKNPLTSWEIIRKIAKRLRKARDEMASQTDSGSASLETIRASASAETNELVYEFFNLSAWERALVEDTHALFEPSSTPSSLESDIPTLEPSRLDDCKTYAELLCQTINRWARRAKYLLTPPAVVAKNEGLVLLTLIKQMRNGKTDAYHEQQPTQQLSDLIDRVALASVEDRFGGLRYLRGFALFEESQVHILKPISRRHWTRTAALNDADEMADFIANMGQDN